LSEVRLTRFDCNSIFCRIFFFIRAVSPVPRCVPCRVPVSNLLCFVPPRNVEVCVKGFLKRQPTSLSASYVGIIPLSQAAVLILLVNCDGGDGAHRLAPPYDREPARLGRSSPAPLSIIPHPFPLTISTHSPMVNLQRFPDPWHVSLRIVQPFESSISSVGPTSEMIFDMQP
jgi:hypothetical protein